MGSLEDSDSTAREPLVQAGIAVMAAGLAFGVIALLPLIAPVELPSAFWGLSMLVGVGLLMILVGLFRAGRRRSRAQRQATAPKE